MTDSPAPYASHEIHAGGKTMTLHYRQSSAVDLKTIQHVFGRKGYEAGHWPQGRALRLYYETELADAVPLIIDAGANIGASACFFKAMFERSFIFAIEPEASNADLFEYNMANLGGFELFRGGFAGHSGEMFLRKGPHDWSHRVQRQGEIPIPVIDGAAVLRKFAATSMKPFICKIDIEGGEADVFDGPSEWMGQFPCIILEPHDWLIPFQASSGSFLRALSRHDFDVVHRGEHIFCFNNSLLKHYSQHPVVTTKPPRPVKMAPPPPTLSDRILRMFGLMKAK